MTTWIAEERVVFLHANGHRSAGRIAIVAPMQRDQDCACAVALDGLQRPGTIFGDTTLQALLLAAQFLGFRLHDFISRGGRVLLSPDDETTDHEDVDAPLSASFGPLLRHPEPPSSDDLSEM